MEDEEKEGGARVSLCSSQFPVSDLWEVIAAVAALPPVQQGLQLGQVPPERSRRLRLLLLLLPLLEVLELLPLLAVLLYGQALCWTEGCQQGLRVQRAGPGPRRLLFVCQHAHHGLAQHSQADLGNGAFEAVLGGQAVVKALVGQLDGADEEAVLRGEDTVAQLHLWLGHLGGVILPFTWFVAEIIINDLNLYIQSRRSLNGLVRMMCIMLSPFQSPDFNPFEHL